MYDLLHMTAEVAIWWNQSRNEVAGGIELWVPMAVYI
jgi:hypothetical protein